MSPRERLERELDHLQSMLPPWREKLRDETQFWPQFDVLAARILDSAEPADRDYVRQRIALMLQQQGLLRPPALQRGPRRRGP